MLSVVIPKFNEIKNIRNLVEQIDVDLKGVDYEIVFVDDSMAAYIWVWKTSTRSVQLAFQDTAGK